MKVGPKTSARPRSSYPLTALRLAEQVAKFAQSALDMGLSTTEVVEAIIQTAPATGFPPALNALGAISIVFR